MTDPETADVTYIEPLTVESVERIIAKEKPDALLPTLGGQTALNLSLKLARTGVLAKYGVELIGAKEDAIERGEDREIFKKLMLEIGLDVPRSRVIKNLEEARATVELIGGQFPIIIRPSYTLGGTGGAQPCAAALQAMQALLGWQGVPGRGRSGGGAQRLPRQGGRNPMV
jgi:carbamoyl-phosphate synthase large subunit